MNAMQERQIKETAEHYRAIFESVADPVLLIDIDDFTLLQSNEAAKRWALLLNVSLEADTCHGIVAGRNVPCELFGEECSILRMLEGQEKTATVYRRDYGPGGNHFIEETASPVRDSEGEIIRAVLVVRDVTDSILVEQRITKYL
jgi:PAS domain-containing protein